MTTSHSVTGGGGVRLNVSETGNPRGKPILFIHGFSQCSLAWNKQLHSTLAKDFRLVAMDIRGHGLSEKPHDAYSDSKMWAEDVQAVITALDLDKPVLSGWSHHFRLYKALWRGSYCRNELGRGSFPVR